MERVNLSNSTSLSRIVYGMWRLADDTNVSSQHIGEKINICLDQGINSFDLAAEYGLYTSYLLFVVSFKSNACFRV